MGRALWAFMGDLWDIVQIRSIYIRGLFISAYMTYLVVQVERRLNAMWQRLFGPMQYPFYPHHPSYLFCLFHFRSVHHLCPVAVEQPHLPP
jgi:hypothetical protein